MLYYIYAIKNDKNNKIYVGQTYRSINQRFKEHMYSRNKNKKCCVKLMRAIRKYEISNFRVELLAVTECVSDIDSLEEFFIKYYNSIQNGYNLTPGGKHFVHTKETKEKMSKAMKKYYETHKNWLKDKKLSKETKNKISKSRIGKYKGSNNAMYGKRHNINAKLAISKTNQKIDDSIVIKIKHLSSTKKYTGRQLSKMFHISTAQISRIINNKQRSL